MIGPRAKARCIYVTKWSLLLACLLIAALWIVSLRWTIKRDDTHRTHVFAVVRLADATLTLTIVAGPEPKGVPPPRVHWSIERRRVAWDRDWRDPRLLNWRLRVFRVPWLNYFVVHMPLWMLLTPCLLAGALLWYVQPRYYVPGHCVRCGYSLAGLAPGSRCPECGKARR